MYIKFYFYHNFTCLDLQFEASPKKIELKEKLPAYWSKEIANFVFYGNSIHAKSFISH